MWLWLLKSEAGKSDISLVEARDAVKCPIMQTATSPTLSTKIYLFYTFDSARAKKPV